MLPNPAADKLNRTVFVKRIEAALVKERHTNSSRVIGLLGAWGSGKTFIINMLEKSLEKGDKEVIFLRFQPWLISGRDDLVSAFFDELKRAVRENEEDSLGDEINRALNLIEDYEHIVTPVWGAVKAGLASSPPKLLAAIFAEGGYRFWQGNKQKLQKEENQKPLHEKKKDLSEALSALNKQIIIAIDDIDRLPDEDIFSVTQLVRAIADFPAISYLLSYDHNHVVSALNRQNNTEDGAEYMEKIVNYPLYIPILDTNELADYFFICFEEVMEIDNAFEFFPSAKLIELLGICIPHLVNTPRDIKRWVDAFEIHYAMISDEVYRTDLLAFTLLELKHHNIVEIIQSTFPLFAQYAPITEMPLLFSENKSQKQLIDERLQSIRKKYSASEWSAIYELLKFLFSATLDYEQPEKCRTQLDFYIPLKTVLKKGIGEDSISREDIESFLEIDLETKINSLSLNFEYGRFEDFINAFFRYLNAGQKVNPELLPPSLEAFASFFDTGYEDSNFDPNLKTDKYINKFIKNLEQLGEVKEYRQSIYDFVSGLSKPNQLSKNLLASILLRTERRKENAEYLTDPYHYETFKKTVIKKYQDEFRKQTIFSGLRTAEIFELMLSTDSWEGVCKTGLKDDLKHNHNETFKRFIKLTKVNSRYSNDSIVSLLGLSFLQRRLMEQEQDKDEDFVRLCRKMLREIESEQKKKSA